MNDQGKGRHLPKSICAILCVPRLFWHAQPSIDPRRWQLLQLSGKYCLFQSAILPNTQSKPNLLQIPPK